MNSRSLYIVIWALCNKRHFSGRSLSSTSSSCDAVLERGVSSSHEVDNARTYLIYMLQWCSFVTDLVNKIEPIMAY